MFFGFDLQEILKFPIKDEESRKYFLIGCLVALAAFVIPILPYILLFGYMVRIARQIQNNESPRMVAWDDWGGMMKDGVKVFGIRLAFFAPVLIILIPMICVMTIFPIVMENANNGNMDAFAPIYALLISGVFCCIVPLSIPLSFITPGAELYVIEKDDFMAGFKFNEWWPIFRANLSGFFAAIAITYIAAAILGFVTQILAATVILACLIFILTPAITIYMMVIMFTLNALAFKEGKNKLAQQPTSTEASA